MKSAREFYAGYLGIPISAFDGFRWSSGVTHHFSTDQLWNTLQAALSDGYQTGYAQVSQRDASIAQLTADRTRLQNELLQKNQSISSLERSNSGLSSQISSLISQINSSNSQVRSLTSQLTAERAKVSQRDTENGAIRGRLETENARLQSKLQQADNKNISLEKQLSESKLALDTCNDEIRKLQMEIAKLKNEMSQSKDKAESKMAEVNTRIGLFKQIIAAPSDVDLSNQKSVHKTITSNIQ